MRSSIDRSSDDIPTHESLIQWEEVTGRVLAIDEVSGGVTVELSTGVVFFPDETGEANIIRTKLEHQVDKPVSILRTNSPENPLRIQIGSNERSSVGGANE